MIRRAGEHVAQRAAVHRLGRVLGEQAPGAQPRGHQEGQPVAEPHRIWPAQGGREHREVEEDLPQLGAGAREHLGVVGEGLPRALLEEEPRVGGAQRRQQPGEQSQGTAEDPEGEDGQDAQPREHLPRRVRGRPPVRVRGQARVAVVPQVVVAHGLQGGGDGVAGEQLQQPEAGALAVPGQVEGVVEDDAERMQPARDEQGEQRGRSGHQHHARPTQGEPAPLRGEPQQPGHGGALEQLLGHRGAEGEGPFTRWGLGGVPGVCSQGGASGGRHGTGGDGGQASGGTCKPPARPGQGGGVAAVSPRARRRIP